MKKDSDCGLFSSFVLHPSSLICWYRKNRRDLPWRAPAGFPDPYHVLLSELMLQQTQVVTVVPYFHRFVARFPTIAALAEGEEQEVLRLWQGLGYYSRARNLHRAAREIVARYGGEVPREVGALLELPGIGRYTAGAIASLAYGVRAAILDGNVQRVLCRLHAIADDPRGPKVNAALWRMAEEMLPQREISEFNSALMELGATICTPRNPRCEICPAREHCRAMELGVQDRIPPAKKVKARRTERRWVFCIEHEGKWLIEQRPSDGRWARMWQFVTVPAGDGEADAAAVRLMTGVGVRAVSKLGMMAHDLTHRHYEFVAYRCRSSRCRNVQPRRWARLDELAGYAMPKAHAEIARWLADQGAVRK